MANRLNVMMGEEDCVFTAALVRRDLFGRKAAVEALVAESDGKVTGYVLYHDGYDSDLAARSLFLVDMFVEERSRRGGIGRRLMVAVANEAMRRGARSVSWAVLTRNRAARAFYKKLGAMDEGARVNELYANALERLARGAGHLSDA
jgi:hypothetical protein